MKKDLKTGQLQMRVSEAQKREIQERARRAGMSVTDWVLAQIVPSTRARFQDGVAAVADSDAPDYEFAELLELLQSLGPHEFSSAVAEPPVAALDADWSNYVAATVEHAAALKRVPPPAWTREVAPLDEPLFGSQLRSVRLHLLTHAPPAFRRRNLFIDATVGSRV